jgi:hypothetical protein
VNLFGIVSDRKGWQAEAGPQCIRRQPIVPISPNRSHQREKSTRGNANHDEFEHCRGLVSHPGLRLR